MVDPAETIVVMGRVAAPYGVHGCVRIHCYCASPQTLLDQEQWWLRPLQSQAWQVTGHGDARIHGAAVLARFAGVDDRDAAERLRGTEVGVARSMLPALATDEYYWADLVGLDVVNREGVALGQVTDIAEFGAHPVLRVRAPAAPAGSSERLIPLIGAFVDRVDLTARRIDVDWQPDY